MKVPSSRLIRGEDTQKYTTEGAISGQCVGLPPRCMCVSDAPWLADDGLIEDINAGVTAGEEREPHSWLVKSIPEDHNLLWVAFECYSWQWSMRRPLARMASGPDLPQPSARSLHSLSSRGRSTAAVETMVQRSLKPTTPGTRPHCLVASAECGGCDEPRSRSLRVLDISRPQRQQVYEQTQRNSIWCISRDKNVHCSCKNHKTAPQLQKRVVFFNICHHLPLSRIVNS